MNSDNLLGKYFAAWILFVVIVCVTLMSFAIIDIQRSKKTQEENVSTFMYGQAIGGIYEQSNFNWERDA